MLALFYYLWFTTGKSLSCIPPRFILTSVVIIKAKNGQYRTALNAKISFPVEFCQVTTKSSVSGVKLAHTTAS